MKQDEPDYSLITKFIDKQTNTEETAKVLDWISKSEENKVLYFRMKQIADQLDVGEPVPANDAVWEKIEAVANRRPAEHNDLPEEARAPGSRPFKRRYLKYAAVLFLLICCGLLFRTFNRPRLVTVQVEKNGRMRKIILPDQSVVWLKPGGKIDYHAGLPGPERSINLTGEAFFKVRRTQDASGKWRPFSVHTANLQVNVLGTAFHVTDAGVRKSVVVSSGLVSVKHGTTSLRVAAGEAARLKGASFEKSNIDTVLFDGILTGNYRFNNTGINELVNLLELASNGEVKVEHPATFAAVSLNGRIKADDKEALCRILAVMLNAEIIQETNHITIKPNKPM